MKTHFLFQVMRFGGFYMRKILGAQAKLDCYEFGQQLLETNDLDPIYVILHRAAFDRDHLHKWLLSYFCFYHCGTASWIVDQPDYWDAMETAAGSKEWPRSAERRHFRGNNAVNSVAWLRDEGLDNLFDGLYYCKPTAAAVMAQVKTWTGFGPWIAFKVADMLERLGLMPLTFEVDEAMYDGSPTQGAQLLWETEGSPDTEGQSVTAWAVGRILDELWPAKAPPRYERPINVQEAETICCKSHSATKGHYHVGKDIAEVRHGLMRFVECKTARALLQAGKKELW